VCLWGVNGLKKLLGADDALDVFGVHAVGGILGALLTGVFNSPDLGGPGFVTDWVTMKTGYSGIGAQLWIQLKAVVLVLVWTGVVAAISYKIADLIVGLRVTEEEEREGLGHQLPRGVRVPHVSLAWQGSFGTPRRTTGALAAPVFFPAFRSASHPEPGKQRHQLIALPCRHAREQAFLVRRDAGA